MRKALERAKADPKKKVLCCKPFILYIEKNSSAVLVRLPFQFILIYALFPFLAVGSQAGWTIRAATVEKT